MKHPVLSGVLEASKCGFLRQLCSHTWQGPWHRPGPMDPDGSRWIQGNQTAAPKKVRRTSAGARRKSSSPSACANQIHRNDPPCLKSLNISRNGTDSAFIRSCLASDYDYSYCTLSETWGKTSQWCRSCWQPKNSSQGLSEAGYRDWIGGTSSVEQCQAVDESLAVNENDENEFITMILNLIDRLVLPRTRNQCVGFKSITPKSLLVETTKAPWISTAAQECTCLAEYSHVFAHACRCVVENPYLYLSNYGRVNHSFQPYSSPTCSASRPCSASAVIFNEDLFGPWPIGIGSYWMVLNAEQPSMPITEAFANTWSTTQSRIWPWIKCLWASHQNKEPWYMDSSTPYRD